MARLAFACTANRFLGYTPGTVKRGRLEKSENVRVAAAGGALCILAAATCGPLPFLPAPLLLPPGVEVTAELEDRLSAVGGERIAFGSTGAVRSEARESCALVIEYRYPSKASRLKVRASRSERWCRQYSK